MVRYLLARGQTFMVCSRVFYQVQKLTYEDNLPQIKDIPLVFQKIEDVDIRKAMEEFV